MLKRIFRPKREEVVGGWRMLHDEELYNLYASPNITEGMESKRTRLVAHVARMGDMTCVQNVGRKT
jgi:hypothetical protein